MNESQLKLHPIEKEIRNLYLLLHSNQQVVESFFSNLSGRILTPEEQTQLTPFFWVSGANIKLLEIFKDHLKHGYPIAWASFVETLFLSQCPVSEEFADLIYIQASDSGQLEELSKTTLLDPELPNLIDIRRERQNKIQQKWIERKQRLNEEADLYKNQDMQDEEIQVIKLLSCLDPKDPEVKAKFEDLNKRRALKLLESKVNLQFLNKEPNNPTDTLANDQYKKTLAQIFSDQILKNKMNPDLVHSYFVGLYQMELYEEAIAIVESHIGLKIDPWLLLQFYLSTERFLKALEMLDAIESSQLDTAKKSTEIQYERAKICWGLNQKNKALKLLDEIVLIDPEFRDVSTLIRQWRDANRA